MADGIRILYVDDEVDLLELGKMFLEIPGQFTVDTSASALRSLDSPSLLSYDAVVSDYKMPEMDGIAFLKEIRRRYGNIPFILFTGRGREEVVIEAINNGADFYLQKGGSPEAMFAELAHKVRQAVARRNSESEIVSIFRAVPVGIAVVANRVLTRVNDRLCTLTGYPREELEGRNTRFLYLNDEDYVAVGKMREQAYREGDADEIEIPWQKKDGTVIDVRITAAAIDRSNPMAPMTYSALDITREKKDHRELRAAYEQLKASAGQLQEQYAELARSEERLKTSEAEIAGILRAAPVSIGLMSANRAFLRVNDRFCEIIGYSREEIIGRDARFLYQDDEEYARAGKFYSLRADRGDVMAMETRFVQKNGRVLDIRLYGTPSDPANPAAGNIFIALDITEEKGAQKDLHTLYEKIQESEMKYRLLTELTNDIIYTMDTGGRITYVSPRIASYGYSQDEIVSHHFSEFVEKDDLPAVIEAFHEMLESGKPVIEQMRLRDKAGNILMAEDSATPIRNHNGTITGIYGILRDLTGRKEPEKNRDGS
nr:PAS domain S-box protein [uncultured Methanoregula sp.]